MIYEEVSAPPALQGGVDPAWLFFIDDSATIIHAAAVTHLVLFENYGLVIDA